MSKDWVLGAVKWHESLPKHASVERCAPSGHIESHRNAHAFITEVNSQDPKSVGG